MTNIDILKNWVAALRSGKYQQGQRYLHTNDHFCCLGVLCEINNLPRVDHPNDDFSGYRYMYSSSMENLPDLFANKLGIDIDPMVMCDVENYPHKFWNLSILNDVGCSFNAIANLIETQLIPKVKEMPCEL